SYKVKQERSCSSLFASNEGSYKAKQDDNSSSDSTSYEGYSTEEETTSNSE
ncbi:hypothetical protein GWI33_012873, partial [Rhynchophorus ferrugineus]